MASGPDDEFNQFLDMTGIGSIPDAGAMQFDFHGFNDGTSAGTQPMMAGAAHQHQHQHPQNQHQHQHQHQQPRQAPAAGDALMTDSDPSSMIPRSDGLLQNHTPAMSTSVSHPSVAAHMLATSAPDSISTIDAQIHYLQQQKFHQQQRQLHEQQATFYGPHGHSVPPTPQSLEMPPGSGQFYSQAEQMPQRTAYDRSYHQRVAEQDVCGCLPPSNLSHPWRCLFIMSDTNLVHRWPLHLLFLLPSPLWILTSTWSTTLLFLARTSVP